MSQEEIVIRGAREHNLRNVSLTLPRNKLIVMTGVSGSGKSSLAFDTLYAEGQRRYVESLSSYARQFLGQMPKPEVDSISGLAPSISIQQKSSGRNPRSTVGTITEIYDYLRVLFARVGQGCCPSCQQPIQAQSLDQIVDRVASLPAGTRYLVLAPLIHRQKGEYRDLFEDLLKQGFLRARVDGVLVQLSDDLKLDRQMRHTIEVVVDRLQAGVERSRLAESLESAIRLSKGSVIISIPTEAPPSESDPPRKKPSRKTAPLETPASEQHSYKDQLFSTHYACAACGISYEPPSPQLFSFNSPQGMCPDCQGLGVRHDFDLDLLIPDHSLSLYKGAVILLGPLRKMGRWRRHLYEGVARFLAGKYKTTLETILKDPWEDLPEEIRHDLLYGTGNQNITFAWRHRGGIWKHGGTFAGIIPELLEGYRTSKNPMFRAQLEKRMRVVSCQTCEGTRLNRQARNVRVKTLTADWESDSNVEAAPTKSKRTKRTGPVAPRPSARRRDLSLTDVCALSIAEADRFFEQLDLDETGRLIADEAIKEIRGRLGFLLRCGLDYLTLDRTAPTLSGGESQRIRLASQIGCGLVGVVYILDEPSIGLHPRDNTRLLQSLIDLRDQGNTVIVVEHDEETMLAADRIVDFGPGPGVRGGEIVAEGSLADVKKSPRSETGKFLSGRESIPIPVKYRTGNGKQLIVRGASHNNLREIDVEFPLGTFICVTGVSGSGKSSLVNDILWEVLNRDLNRGDGKPGAYAKIEGLEHLDKGIDIDQSPIGRTPRSNPATYVKLFDQIRDLYANLPDSKVRGYEPGRFSFNVPGGRCEACEGHGATRLEMDFLADLWVTCPVCEGKRFNRETLEIRFKGKNIAEVLDMDVQQALEHFENLPRIAKLLQALHDVGLDYIKLGQASPTLSGGEAQRIKLARELGKRSTGKTIYLLDEPTTGLHFADIKKLLQVLHSLVDAGNTVLVVEHNLDVIKTADWVIDLGPEGGAGGGRILVEGTPTQVSKEKNSYTGLALKPVLKGEPFLGLPGAYADKKSRPKESNFNSREIVVRGAAQHNLQHVDLTIPRNRLSVFCGPSGSGKSSLAMETLYAEGQRRYVESLSSYARQFLGQMPKPKVEHISGLSPAIAIEQKTTGNTPRSTVGTVTEIYDYLRILFARLGQSFCPDCQIPIDTQTTDQVLDKIMAYPAGSKFLILAPREVEVGQAYTRIFEDLSKSGFTRVRIDGTSYRLDEVPEVDRRRKHKLEIVVDRVALSPSERSRISDSVEAAFDLGKGVIRCVHVDESQPEKKWRIDQYSLHFACDKCGRSFEELNPHHFSFNSSLGWCPSCEGLGVQQGTNLTQLIPQPRRSLVEGAVSVWPDVRRNPMFRSVLDSLADHFDIELDKPFQDLDPSDQRIVMHGAGEEWIPLKSADKKHSGLKFQYKGLFPSLEEAGRVSYSYRQRLTDMVGEVPCTTCGGSRLREDAGAVRLEGKTLQHVCEMSLGESLQFFKGIKFKGERKRVAGDLLHEVVSRLSFLVDVGLDYLALGRTLPSLSGGETQRIRLAGQIGRALTGVMYVLDEPTIGLHPRDNARLLKALRQLRDLGNTLILVEHDREILEAADTLYDFGPGAGRFGGRVTAAGTPKSVSRNDDSLTGGYLGGSREIPIPQQRRMTDVVGEKIGKRSSKKSAADSTPAVPPGGGWLELRGARMHNLRDVDLKIPLGTFTCITGVSGSGKSSLIEETLSKAVARRLHRTQDVPGPFDELVGLELVNKIITVDQQPLGSTPASNPATYTGVFEQIRELFARLPESKIRGYRPARFSFNRPGGRCEACEGNGQKCIEMHFLPDVWVECDVCRGKRFNEETLSVKYRNRSINDVLEMSIGQAAELFDNIPKIRGILATLCAIGLDYLTLGQSAATLSGGEAQRVKLAAELARPQTGRTLYILDEPTTGLHFEDIRKLLKVLDSLVEMGNTVVVIEHNLDVIKTADWLIDLGPEAGHAGGWIVAEGTPEFIVERATDFRKHPRPIPPEISTGILEKNLPQLRSYTGEMLTPVLQEGTRQAREIFDARAAAEKKQGDLELHQVGKGTKMPWQVDGRAWHTVDRIALNGAKCRWDGSALAHIIDLIAESEIFAEPNWNARTLVEIAAPGKGGQWFLHALTGDEWLLTLKFRVRKNLFQEEALGRALKLKDIDDLDEIPIYGRAPRVRIKTIPGGQHEVAITIHWLREVQTPEFAGFLQTAIESCREQSVKKPLNLDDLTPWKVLGKKWHLSRKGFPSNKRVAWEAELLERLADLLTKAGSVRWDWGNKQVVHAYPAESDSAAPWASIHTKRREGLDLNLFAPAGKFSLGRIAEFGDEREISSAREGLEQISIRFSSAEKLHPPQFSAFLREHFSSVVG